MFLFSPCYTGYISRFQLLGVNFYFLGATTWQKYVLPFYMQKPLSIHSREATHTFCNGCTVKGNVTLYVSIYERSVSLSDITKAYLDKIG